MDECVEKAYELWEDGEDLHGNLTIGYGNQLISFDSSPSVHTR